MNRTLKRKDVEQFLINTKGGFFGVTFIKRTTGEIRKMNARLNVKKHLKGGQRAYDPKAHNLIFCFDMVSGGYRCIPLEGVKEIRFNSNIYKVVQ